MKTDIYYELTKEKGEDYERYINELIEEKVCEVYIELSEKNEYQHIPFKEELIEGTLEEIINHSDDLGIDLYIRERKEEVSWLDEIENIKNMKEKGVANFLRGYEKLIDDSFYRKKIEKYLLSKHFLLIEHEGDELKWINQLEEYVW